MGCGCKPKKKKFAQSGIQAFVSPQRREVYDEDEGLLDTPVQHEIAGTVTSYIIG